MSHPWDFLKEFKGEYFKDEWPTIAELLRITTARFPDKRGFTLYDPEEIKFTWSEVSEHVDKISSHLISKGVNPGDKVGLTGKNSPQWALAYLATVNIGAVIVPLDNSMSTEKSLELFKFAGITALFVDEEKFDDFDMKAMGIKTKIALYKGNDNYIMNIELEEAFEYGAVRSEELAAILFTSGTTGNPKGVMLTHENLVSDTFLTQEHMTILPSDVFYALLPIHHIYTMTAVFLVALSAGAEILFGQTIAIQVILPDLKKGKVTMFLGVPLLFNKLIKGIMRGVREKGILVYGIIRFLMGISGMIKKIFKVNPGKKLFNSILKKVSLENIRICISGGGPLPPETFRKFNQLGVDFVQGYGLTESSPILNLNPVAHYKEKSVGKLIPGIEMIIHDPDEKGVGEIWVRGPVVMRGYYNNQEATEKVLDEDGFLHTGDMGYLDNEDYLYLSGRKNNIIVTSGGKNVFPEEIEYFFTLYDEVEQSLIKGFIADKKLKTEHVEAVIFPSIEFFEKDHSDLTGHDDGRIHERIGEIVKEINEKMPIYMRIKKYHLIDQPMEMTSTKKIQRYKVKE
ncbi:AMP-binding protein [bacterium]|nr:AMP-binding protein [bacterium]